MAAQDFILTVNCLSNLIESDSHFMPQFPPPCEMRASITGDYLQISVTCPSPPRNLLAFTLFSCDASIGPCWGTLWFEKMVFVVLSVHQVLATWLNGTSKARFPGERLKGGSLIYLSYTVWGEDVEKQDPFLAWGMKTFSLYRLPGLSQADWCLCA